MQYLVIINAPAQSACFENAVRFCEAARNKNYTLKVFLLGPSVKVFASDDHNGHLEQTKPDLEKLLANDMVSIYACSNAVEDTANLDETLSTLNVIIAGLGTLAAESKLADKVISFGNRTQAEATKKHAEPTPC